MNRAPYSASILRPACIALLFVLLASTITARAADWDAAEQQLARKIVAVTGPGAVAITVENRSSLGRRDSEVVQNGLQIALEQLGIHFVNTEQAAATITLSLSETPSSYVWVVQIRQSEPQATVVMVSVPRPAGPSVAHDSMPITLRKTLLWTQDEPVLDVAILEENASPTRIAVLDPEGVSLYRWQSGKWQQEQMLEIAHARPWPRDVGGRLIPAKDHLLDVYLPGVICRSSSGAPLAISCREADDPWPLVPPEINANSSVFPSAGSNTNLAPIAPTAAFFASARNFFTGVLTPAVGKLTSVPKFYSAAWLPRGKYTLWLFAATDERVHLVDGVSDQSLRSDWGSDIGSVRTSCGAGWQVLATSPGEQSNDSVRAYEFPDRDPVAVSAAVDFPGVVTALWTEAKGDTAIAVVRSQETGKYEAYRLAVDCSQ